MTRRGWTTGDDKEVLDFSARGFTNREISLCLPGRTESAVACRLTKLNPKKTKSVTKPTPEMKDSKLRKCLGPECEKVFMSENKGNRLCKNCRKTIGSDSSWMGTW